MEKENQKWKTIEPGMWKPEKDGDSITGILVTSEPANNEFSARYHIENAEGTFLVWGSTILDDRMRVVKTGSEVRITYKGKVKNKKGQDLKMFKVEIAERSPIAEEVIA